MATSVLDRSGAAPLQALPRAISADSHIIEPPEAYTRHIDPQFRDRVPQLVHDPVRGDSYVVEGLPGQIAVASISACGKRARPVVDEAGVQQFFFDGLPPPFPDGPFADGPQGPRNQAMAGMTFADAPAGGWQTAARLEAQDRDGVIAEVIYPTMGMVLCNHPDSALQNALFQAYNHWLAEMVAEAPTRLFGIGQTALRTVKEGVEDFRRIKEMGFVGVMLPGAPDIEGDWYEEQFDPLWEAAQDLDLPVSFHTLASGRNKASGPALLIAKKGKNVNFGQHVLRANQDAVTDFILGGVFQRFPKLKLVCVEAGAGWAADYVYRIDHFYAQHRFLNKVDDIGAEPSHYFFENVYLTFQDDPVALQLAGFLNTKRLLWANDYPHSDATWPWSRNLLAQHMKHMSEADRQRILHDNVKELYGLRVD